MALRVLVPSHPKGSNTGYTPKVTSLSPVRGSPNGDVPKSFGFLAQTVLWDPGDKAVRRFSEPAVDANNQRLAACISSARTAYAKAFVSIQQSSKNVDLSALLKNSTEREVAELALEVDANSAAQEKEKGPVSRLVGVLHHYHDVFDVLSQADLSYLPLIWGGMKLILILAKNRTDLLDKLADMLVEVGMSLSRIEVYTKLYPTARMVELTSILYAAVIDFLQEVITTFQRSAVRQMFSSLVRPFDEKFGRLVERIRRLETSILQDASLLHALQTASMAHHQLDSFLQRQKVEAALKSIPKGDVPDIFVRIKETLFQGFEHQASYHESLTTTYSVTSGAWEQWFKEEQKYLPSRLGTSSRLIQGICDAPDFQHALQWSKQQQELSPHVPSAYIIWARGMTAHSAIASLIFQVLQQRPAVVSEQNLDLRMFKRANTSIKALWDVFVHLMRVLGGCLVYISIGSVGPDEFAVVEKFVKTVRNWDGLPICVTIIHPYHEGFVCVDDVTDLDGAYDVHPSMTTTDALHHVLMLELGVREVSDTIQTVLWESLWRETRFAVVGVSMTQFLSAVQSAAEGVSQDLEEDKRELWSAGVQKWTNDGVSTNNVRELIQRHLDIVPLEPTDEMRSQLTRHVKLAVFRAEIDPGESLDTRSLTQPQRDRVWGRMEAAMVPGTTAMFCGLVQETVEEAMERFSDAPPSDDARQASRMIRRLLDGGFGRKGSWKEAFADDKQLIIGGVADAIKTGFEDAIVALLEPQRTGHSEAQ